MSGRKAPTVEDIRWHVNTELSGGVVFAEDQFIVYSGLHSKRIVDDHNRLLEIAEILTGSVYQGDDAYAILDDIKRIALATK